MYTALADMKLFDPYLLEYLQQYTTENSALLKSGIATSDPVIASIVASSGAAGRVVNLPFFNDLSGDDEAISETALTENNIGTGQDTAVIHRRAKAFAATDVARALSGNDPYKAIVALIGDYVNRQRQKMLFDTLTGIFAANQAQNNGDLILDTTDGDDLLDEFMLLDAAQLLGDAKGKLTGIAMSSAAEVVLHKACMKSQTYTPANQTTGELATYAGKKIIVDDNVSYNSVTGVAEIYLFGEGAFALENAQGAEPTLEPYREELASRSGIIERDSYILHPRGIKWQGTITGTTPTRDLVKAATSWSRVYDKKNVRICKLVCRIHADNNN